MLEPRKRLLEAYAKKLSVAEKVYSNTHSGDRMSYNTKVTTAVLLNNVSKFLKENWDNSVGVQRSNLGDYKKFCLTVTNVAFPSLIAEDLVLVRPMTSFTGYVAYAKFTYGSNKGGIKQGQVIADPWMIYPRNEDNTNYSSQAVVESLDAANATYAPAWTPIVKGAFVDEGGVAHDAKFIAADDGAVTYLDASEDGTFNVTEAGRIAYQYDNIKIPANDLPHIGIEMDKITLEAKARRLAITYSQIAAFQYKTDYDADMQTALAEHAVAELKLEIDEEIIMFLANMGSKKENVIAEAEFNKKIPVGVAVADHYKSLIEKIDTLKTEIFTRTGRYGATFMLIDPSMRKYFSYLPDFKAAPVKGVIGAHFVGTLEGLKIYTTPRLNKTNKFFVGVKGEDFVAAAVYAPYMPIIPTQLLGYADGTMSQGFTTMYDLKAINEQLVVCGEVVDKDYPAITTKVGE